MPREWDDSLSLPPFVRHIVIREIVSEINAEGGNLKGAAGWRKGGRGTTAPLIRERPFPLEKLSARSSGRRDGGRVKRMEKMGVSSFPEVKT